MWGQQQNNQSGNGMFGGGSSTGNTGTGMFGGGGFGNTASGFGQQQQQQQPQQQQQQGGFGSSSFFGNTAQNTASRPGGFFGGGGASSGFGASNTAAPSTGGFGFGGGSSMGTSSGFMGQQQQPQSSMVMNVGSGNPPFQATPETDASGSITKQYHQALTAMPAYQGKSFEEIRLEDYQAGRRYPAAKGFGVSSGFGASAATTSTGGFGSATSTGGGGGFGMGGFGSANQPQQQQSVFGGGSAFGASSFGSSTTAPGGGFGASSAFGAANASKPPTTSGFGFGATQQPSAFGGSTFGAGATGATSTTGGGLFGSSAKPSITTNTGFGGFGATNTTGTTSAFGSSTAPVTGTGFGGGFGSTQPTSGFGTTNVGGGGFGGTTTSFGGFGGTGTGATSTMGAFGQQPQAQMQQQQQPQQSAFGFGGTTAATTTMAPTATGFGAFGTAATASTMPTTTPSLFGASGGGLGATSTTTGLGLFNKPATTTQQPTLFGATGAFGGTGTGIVPTTAATTGGGLFGATTTFGASTLPTTMPATTAAAPLSLFGASSNVPGVTSSITSSTMPSFTGTSFGGLGTTAAIPVATTTAPSLFGTSATTTGFGGGALTFPATTTVASTATVPTSSSSLFPSAVTPAKPLGTIIPTIDSKPYGSSPLFTTFTSGPSAAVAQTLQQKQLALSARRFTPKPVTQFKPRGLPATPTVAAAAATGGKDVLFQRASGMEQRTPLKIGGGTPKPANATSLDYLGGSVGKTAKSLVTRSSVKELVIMDGAPMSEKSSSAAVKNGPGSLFSTPLASKSTNVVLREISLSKQQQQPSRPLQVNGDKDSDYTSSPSLSELSQMSRSELRRISNFRVSRKEIGTILFLQPVDLTAFESDLSAVVQGEIVNFEEREVTVYPDESIKPPVGQGLNVPARITLERCWPKGQSGPNAEALEKHIRRLKRVPDTKFISFDDEKGEWCFEVEHFTRYGLDEDEDEPLAATAIATKATIGTTSAIKEQIIGQDNSYEYYVIERDEESSEDGNEEEFILQGDEDAEIVKVAEAETEAEPEDADEENDNMIIAKDSPVTETPYFERYHNQSSSILPRQLGLSAARIQNLQEGLFGSQKTPLFVPKQTPLAKQTPMPRQASISKKIPISKPFEVSPAKKPRVTAKMDLMEEKIAFKVKPVVYEKSLRFGRDGSYQDKGLSMGASFGGCFCPNSNTFVMPFRNMSNGAFGIAFKEIITSATEKDNPNAMIVTGLFRDQKTESSSRQLGFFEECRLEFLLEHSSVSMDSGFPKFKIQPGDSTTFRALINYQNNRQDNSTILNQEEAHLPLWKLCSALFDPVVARGGEHERKVQLIKFFSSSSSVFGDGSAPWKILHFLISYNLEEAQQEALRAGYPRLSLLLCQAPGSEEFRTLIREQVATWKSEGTRINLQIMSIYELMAGSVESLLELLRNDKISRSNSFDWKLAFGLFLCYSIEEWDCWTIAFKLFKTWNEKNSVFDVSQDILYLLLELASDPLSVKLESLLTLNKFNAESKFSSEIPFFLYHLLHVRNVANTRNPCQTSHLLIQGYADDLLSKGAASWAIFIMLFQGSSNRNASIFNLLSLTFPCLLQPGVRTFDAIESDASFMFLTQRLSIPSNTLFHVLAHFCLGAAKNLQDSLELFLHAQCWDEAHVCLFSTTWLYDNILAEAYARPLEILLHLKTHSHDGIREWSTRGQVFLQFIQIISSSEVELTTSLYNEMSRSLEEFTLTRRIEETDCIQRKTVCCMEMATRLFRRLSRNDLVLKTSSSGFNLKDSLVLSDEKLNWVKEISFNFFAQ